ncbi:MAG: hypothetical protein UU77_C0009G0010 [candidate division WWE3 bacterium GW2011_GWC1_41_7]|uniref:Uncharacterized protein n=1 Tax=candidate division WWE3 bacterium GW2011_GWC1_41_7 TaxID=1619119 RepID=A0A0G1A6T0_UNCKA|nr:MAG: hypothetical protein UU77_C0009G0010 [candidate division WWE3 bacterium GW2011_GWC1_41_7]
MSIKKWPVWRTVELGMYKNAVEMIIAIQNREIFVSDVGIEMLNNIPYLDSRQKLCLAVLSVEELGIFAKVTTTKRVYTVAKKLGLSLCPEEVGPQLRIEYKDQPDGETLFIAMEPVLISSGYEKMFDVKCQGGKKWLGFTSGSSNYTWRPFDRFVFVIQ